MLHYTTIDTPTLELLTALIKIPELSGLRLVGGTSLALQLGHRTSVDIDLFGKIDIEVFELNSLINALGNVTPLKKSPNIFIYLINNIKVDFVNYPYAWIEDAVIEDTLKLAGKKDIAAMKLSAITGRGSKKDFVDLYFLLKEFSLEEMLDFYKQKYPDGSEFLVLKSLTYFADAEKNEMPKMFERVFWPEVREVIIQSVDDYLNTQQQL